jgi:hypothetical protein
LLLPFHQKYIYVFELFTNEINSEIKENKEHKMENKRNVTDEEKSFKLNHGSRDHESIRNVIKIKLVGS